MFVTLQAEDAHTPVLEWLDGFVAAGAEARAAAERALMEYRAEREMFDA